MSEKSIYAAWSLCVHAWEVTVHKQTDSEPIRLIGPGNESAWEHVRELRERGRVAFTSAGCFLDRLMLGRVRIEDPKDVQRVLQAHGLTRELARTIVHRGHAAAFPQGDPADADTWNALAELAGAKETT